MYIRQVFGFTDCYSFKYSRRPQTPAAELPGSVSPEEAQERLLALQELQRGKTLAYHRSPRPYQAGMVGTPPGSVSMVPRNVV